MRPIDADALEKDYREQFEAVYKHTREAVKPSDFYIERRAAYDKELARMEMEAFCEFLKSRPTVDAEPVRRGRWIFKRVKGLPDATKVICSSCKKVIDQNDDLTYSLFAKEFFLESHDCCPKCGAKMDLEAEK